MEKNAWLGDPEGELTSQQYENLLLSFSKTPFTIQWDETIALRQWEKLAINCAINPLTVLFNCPNGDLLKQPITRYAMGKICNEINGLMHHLGLPSPQTPLIDTALMVANNTATNYSSMLQDHRQSRSTEIDYLNGYVTRQGLTQGVPTPYNELLTRAIKQGEITVALEQLKQWQTSHSTIS